MPDRDVDEGTEENAHRMIDARRVDLAVSQTAVIVAAPAVRVTVHSAAACGERARRERLETKRAGDRRGRAAVRDRRLVAELVRILVSSPAQCGAIRRDPARM